MSTSVQPEPFDPDKALAAVGGPAPSPGSVAGSDTSGFDPDKALADVGGPAKTDDESGSNDSGLMAGISGAAKGLMYGFDKDIAPAAAWAAERLTGQQPAASYAQLKNSYAQHQANQEAAHPIASTVGNIAGLVASPMNDLPNAAASLATKGAGLMPAVVRGAVGGAVTGGMYGAGNATGPVLTRAAAGLKGAALGAPAGAVLGPVAEGIGHALDGVGSLRSGQDMGQLAQDMDANITRQKTAADPYWARVRALGDAPIAGPEVDDLMNAPDAPRAYAEAQRYQANNADAELPPFPTAKQGASDALVAQIRADNPTWSDARVQAATQDPDIVRGYRSGALGGGGQGVRVSPEEAFRTMNIPQQNLADMRAAGMSDDQILDMAAKVTKQPVPVTPAVRGTPPEAAATGTRINGAQIPLRGLQAMKEYLNDFIRRGQDSDNGFTVRNAQALQNTLYRAIGAARDQYPAYGQALDASAGYKALQPIRKALGDMLTPGQYMETGVASGQLTPAQAQTFLQAGSGPGRAIAAKTAGAGILTGTGHPLMGIGMAGSAVRDAAKAFGGGKLSPEQVQQLVEIAQKERSTAGLARLMSRSSVAAPSRTTGLLPRAAAALAGRSGASAAPSSP